MPIMKGAYVSCAYSSLETNSSLPLSLIGLGKCPAVDIPTKV